MVNATEMAKPFGKEPKFWLMNQSTTDYLKELSKVRNLTLTDLVQVTKGGSNPGTWMHEDVAMEFARWLSPAFAIWCNDRIKELMRYGMTATQPTLEQIINNPDLIIRLAMELKNEREGRLRLLTDVELMRAKLAALQAKADFADSFLRQPGDITIDDLAAVLQQKGYRSKGSNTLRQWMRQKGYLIKRGARKNKPTQKSMDKKLMRLVYESSANGTVFITGNGMKHFIGEFAKLHASKTLSLKFAK